VVYAKMAEPIKILYEGLAHVDTRKHVLDGDQGQVNAIAT